MVALIVKCNKTTKNITIGQTDKQTDTGQSYPYKSLCQAQAT